MRNKRFFVHVALVVITGWLTGCAGKFTGGAWIPSRCDPEDKATLGFNLHAEDQFDEDDLLGYPLADTFKGQFQYVDHGCDVAFHGEVEYGEIRPAEFFGGCDRAMFSGTWTSQPRGQSGRFTAYVEDCGEPGTLDRADYFRVTFYDEQNQVVYSHGSLIGGGNIQYHEDDEEEDEG